jgi:site-specific DNA-methyltransferase (adenine-specific)
MTPYYSRDGITIFHGSCFDVFPQLEPVDHVVTDPPYAKIVVNTAKGAPDLGTVDGPSAYRRDLGYAGISDAERTEAARHIGRLARRWSLVFCDAESLTAWRTDLEAGGLRHIRMGCWVSPAVTPQFTGDRPGTGWEACEIAHGRGRCWWNGGGRPAVWIYNRPLNGSLERRALGHPTPKPLALMMQIITDFTDAGDTVLDPFMGSGQTLAACKRLGRKAIGIDLKESYCAGAVERLAQAVLPLAEFEVHGQGSFLGGDADVSIPDR